MHRINAYCTQDAVTKNTVVDVEGIIVDLVTVWKASGRSKTELIFKVDEVFNDVVVSITIPPSAKS